MNPRRAAALCLAAILLPAVLAAQEAAAPANPDIASAELESSVNPFLPGSQSISLGVGLQLPLLAFPAGDTGAANLKLGGSLSIAYNYFLARGLSIGGSLAGAYSGTIGGRSLFIAPLSFDAAYWWSALPFEFCLGGSLGAYLMRLEGHGMIGPYAKLGGGVFWRSTSAWSIGLQPYVWIVPEIHAGDYAGLSRVGAFLETSITAVYHL
jgi:hypothetical protein